MPPPRRGARRRSAPAEPARAGGRLSVRRGRRFKLEARGGAAAAGAADDDDGVPLSDEALLLVFSGLSGATADLVRCAATCRRWRRLVSADAAFICGRGSGAPRSSSDPFIRGLALGFLHSRADGGPPRFVPLPSAAAAVAPRYQASFAALLGGASRVVASRGGRVVLDLCRRANSRVTRAVRLGVCNPVAGAGAGLDVLPPLRGKDSPTGPYACTVVTAADEYGGGGGGDRGVSHYTSYRVLLLYNRRSFTALRCYSSDAGSWGPEAEVTGARIGRSQLAGGPHAAVVHRGVVFWPRLAVALRLDALRHLPAARDGKPRHTVAGFSPAARQRQSERLLGVMPDGRVLRVEADSETIRAYCGGGSKGRGDGVGDGDGDIIGGGLLGEAALRWKWTVKQGAVGVHTVRLRWLCEKSGLVIFTARSGSDPGTHVYTVDVETRQVRRAATGGEASSLGEICGYEMDRETLLASLGR